MQLAFTTVDEFHSLLEQAGEALDYREVWPRLFPVANCPPELMRKLVADIVEGDERFAWESDVHVGLAQWRARHRDLADVAFTVVDLETTGATPGFSKITEIGAVRLEGGSEVGTFAALVNPGVPIPAMITGITGIDDATVAGAPSIDVVLPKFVDFAAHSVLVAHNAQFDLGFLDYELGRLRGQSFPRPALDTLRLARKLCPQQRCSLSALAYRFDTRVKPAHRALHDAQATAELLLLFLSWLQEQGMNTLEEVARFCEPGTRRNYHKISLTEKVPTTPGVYVMRDGAGTPLYIGKAENLRRRTRDHFLQRQAYYARQALELLERIDVIETGSEFGALLLEGRLIAKHRPPYNSHGTRVSSYHYVKLSAEDYPRLYATPNLRDDGSYYAGPFRKASVARRFVDCVNGAYPLRTCAHLPRRGDAEPPGSAGGSRREGAPAGTRRTRGHACPRAGTGACLSPCSRPLNGEYAAVVADVRRVLDGHAEDLDRRLVERQAVLVKALAFEQAARLQNQREALERALRGVRRLRAAARDDVVLVYPAKRRGWIALWGTRGGRIAVEREVGRGAFGEQAARGLLAELAAVDPPRPPLPAASIDETLLVHSWTEAHRASSGVVDLHDFLAGREDAASAAARLLRAVRLAAAGADGEGAAADTGGAHLEPTAVASPLAGASSP
ncbi:MAG TPA: exonuclease domain-containing protein [Thermoleophilia bacterium]|nr:exonuclease domain-containing protein [Thermoleophilia bacterium]